LILFGIVDDIFEISGRGIVLSFDFSKSLGPNVAARVGDQIELRTPGGSTLQTEIRGIEHLKPLVRRKPVNRLAAARKRKPQKSRKGHGNLAVPRWVRQEREDSRWKSG
jgi:hypothetical protein